MATTINGSTGASQIQDDIVTEDKLNLISTATVPSLEAKGSGSQDGYIQLNCYANTHGIKLKSPPHSAGASYTLTFPNNDGDANQFLQTNGSGVLTWAAASGGGGGIGGGGPCPCTIIPSCLILFSTACLGTPILSILRYFSGMVLVSLSFSSSS